MEQGSALGGRLSASAAVAARVMTEAQRLYGAEVDPPVLERCVSQAVANLWTDSIKVTAFVPVLALREVRDMLEGYRRGS